MNVSEKKENHMHASKFGDEAFQLFVYGGAPLHKKSLDDLTLERIF